MTYEVRLSSSARRSLSRVPEKAAAAIAAFLGGPLVEAPHRVGKRLVNELDGIWSARVGPYRILYRIDDAIEVVGVVRIGHRADVYRST